MKHTWLSTFTPLAVGMGMALPLALAGCTSPTASPTTSASNSSVLVESAAPTTPVASAAATTAAAKPATSTPTTPSAKPTPSATDEAPKWVEFKPARVVKSASDVDALPVGAGFKTYLKTYFTNDITRIELQWYRTDGFAFGLPVDSDNIGSDTLWGKGTGAWKEAAILQAVPGCEELTAAKIPEDVWARVMPDRTCSDPKTFENVTYTTQPAKPTSGSTWTITSDTAVRSAVDAQKLPINDGFKAYIEKSLADPGSEFLISGYRSDGWAYGNDANPNFGGKVYLFSDQSGTWAEVVPVAPMVTCADLRKAQVPAEVWRRASNDGICQEGGSSPIYTG